MQRPGIKLAVLAALLLTSLGLAKVSSDVVAHEWGTFTTVAGQDGRAVQWIPLGGQADLPCFVDVFGKGQRQQPLDFGFKGIWWVATNPTRLTWPPGNISTPNVYSNAVIQIRNPLSIFQPSLSLATAQARSQRAAALEAASLLSPLATPVPETTLGPRFRGEAGSETPAPIAATALPPLKDSEPSLSTAPVYKPLNMLTYDQVRAQLVATVRMETPVIYFYSPRETSVSVNVEFPKGLISEWFPPAHVSQPSLLRIPLDSNLTSSIMWKSVRILPAGSNPTLKTEVGESHYYAARQVDANPIRANEQNEKFLFYRGVGAFSVPLLATEMKNGNISVKNTGKVAVPAVVLFENRDGKIGYRVFGELKGSVEMKPVQLNGDLAALKSDLESMLMTAGMYKKEAQAMVETWRDSWFEEGARLFYIVPSSTVDEILPLTILPRPVETKRAFVGRLELITKETIRRVQTALDTENEEMLIRYGRFLGPITDRVMEGASPASVASTKNYVNTVFRNAVERTEKKCSGARL